MLPCLAHFVCTCVVQWRAEWWECSTISYSTRVCSAAVRQAAAAEEAADGDCWNPGRAAYRRAAMTPADQPELRRTSSCSKSPESI